MEPRIVEVRLVQVRRDMVGRGKLRYAAETCLQCADFIDVAERAAVSHSDVYPSDSPSHCAYVCGDRGGLHRGEHAPEDDVTFGGISMEVWVVLDDSPVSQQVIAVFAHAPSQEELDALGPVRQDFPSSVNSRGRPYTTRCVEPWDVRD